MYHWSHLNRWIKRNYLEKTRMVSSRGCIILRNYYPRSFNCFIKTLALYQLNWHTKEDWKNCLFWRNHSPLVFNWNNKSPSVNYFFIYITIIIITSLLITWISIVTNTACVPVINVKTSYISIVFTRGTM